MGAVVSCVDVGQGDCVVAVDSDSGVGMLIDCPANQSQAALEELEHLNMVTLKDVIVTHSQMDHYGGVLDVIDELEDRWVGSLFTNHDTALAIPVIGKNHKGAGGRLRALNTRAREYGERLERAESTTRPRNVGSIFWTLLAPTYAEVSQAISKGDPNLASGVVQLEVGGDCLVVGGDAQMQTWERIASSVAKGAIVRWPHHGGSISSQAGNHGRLYSILRPREVIVSVGQSNRHGHPTSEFFDALRASPSRLICTQATKSCCASGESSGTCGGTIRIDLGGSSGYTVSPSPVEHDRTIRSFSEAKCRLP